MKKNDRYLLHGLKDFKEEFNNLESFAKNVFIIRYFTFIHDRIFSWISCMGLSSNTPEGRYFVEESILDKIKKNEREYIQNFINSVGLEHKISYSIFSDEKDYIHDIMIESINKHQSVGPATIIYLHEVLSLFLFESSSVKNEKKKDSLSSTQKWAVINKRNNRFNSLLKIIEHEAFYGIKGNLKIKEAHAAFSNVLNDLIKNLS